MTINFVFLCPQFPENHRFYCIHLARLGVRVLGIGDEVYDNLNKDLQNSLTEYYRVSSLEDYDQVYRACAYFTHRYGRINRIESMQEYWLELEARLRDDFNMKDAGYSLQQLIDYQRKSVMKQMFQNLNINVARGSLCTTLEAALEFTKEVGYPIVAKPDRGVGASNTFKVNNEEELIELFAKYSNIIGNKAYIMEEYIDGKIVTFDGIANAQGEVVFFASCEYSTGVMDVVNQDLHVFYYVRRTVEQDLVEAGTKAVKAFNVKSRFFHLEFFRQQDGRLVALEANLRPAGGFTVDMYNFAHSVDVYYEYANVVARNRFDAQFLINGSAPNFCCYAMRKKNRSYLATEAQINQKLGSSMVMKREIPAVFAKALGDNSYVFITKEFDTLLENASFIQRLDLDRSDS